jgi:haloacetate dehalogenase
MSELFDTRFPLARRRVDGVSVNFRMGGEGPPLLLLHGFPQTHAIWHRVAPALAAHFTLVLPDLRGYGDTDRPESSADHAPYSKRAMAGDVAGLMAMLGFETFAVCGHDRGGRVAHRLALDRPQRVRQLVLLDISPTLTMYARTTMEFARLYYHWFFLIQPAPLPERLIGADTTFYLRAKLGGWGTQRLGIFDPRALAEYERCFALPGAVHAMCEDYRASAGIDLEHDRADATQKVACPVHALWGEHGVVHRVCTPISDWQEKCALPVTGRALPCGHYIAEELPEVLLDELLAFLTV